MTVAGNVRRQHKWCAERGNEQEWAAGYSHEVNGLADRHNLTLLDTAMPMHADSADEPFGLPPRVESQAQLSRQDGRLAI